MIDSTNQWKDNQYPNAKIYNLVHLQDEQIVATGMEVFSSFTRNITLRTIAKLLLLAFNLKDVKGNSAFSKVEPFLADQGDMQEFDLIENTTLKRIGGASVMVQCVQPDTDENIKKLAIGYSYVAASYLRLYQISRKFHSDT
ncbi:hypothetical protein FCM35_KLT09717 [Carex littledalei]|uniref:Uncharacterized protein n=1 Tax=Carex littledalei TaxID=544730 RepID=A0A833VYD7_9POAL|nr:hypothetical protein FCM35_KLT09717 [Carex littledalei]